MLIAPLLAALAFAADFETGTAVKSDGQTFRTNTIPQIARLGDGRLFIVWWAGNHVYGTFSADAAKTWTAPKLLISDEKLTDGDPNILVDGNNVWVYSTRVPRPNTIKKALTMMVKSTDNGATWSQPKEIFIPRQYTPGKQHNAIKLRDGSYAMGISWDLWAERGMAARTEGEMNLASGLLLSTDGENWTLHGNVYAQAEDKIRPNYTNGLCEPSIVQLDNGEILMILRSGGSRHYEARSRDGGVTWSRPAPSSLTGSNTPSALWKSETNPTEIIAVWNNNPLNRWPLVTAMSTDGGRRFSPPRILSNPGRQASYPGIAQLADGTFIAVWQENLAAAGREIRYAKFTRNWLTEAK